MKLGRRDRGVSVVVNYTITIAISTILMSVLLVGVGGVVDDHRDTAARSELRVIGHQLAESLQSADRLARAGGEAVSIEFEAPRTVAGSTYQIDINATASGSRLELFTESRATRLTVQFVNRTDVDSGTVNGGDLTIVLAADGDLEVRQ